MPGAAVFHRATRPMSGPDLIWPAERPRATASGSEWSQARSNLCLDFHGDPASAQLVVFSDGNHHMALAECVAAPARWVGEWGEAFVAFVRSVDVVAIYEGHGIRSVVK